MPAPIKRNENIAPLSRDHHHGLLFAQRVKKGATQGTAPETLSAYIMHHWNEELNAHFQEEESLLFEKHNAHPWVQQALNEHQQIRQLVQKARLGTAETPDFLLFAALLHQHIRFEERQLFPLLEERFTQAELAAVGNALAHKSNTCVTEFAPAFWKNNP